ncbi:hypothetical protein [Actinospongicola halichondriae]|uniref:hypothetical protein n=1 Tax=Actinospongicola halichondriae TaxID=3236844 RepID=UPI003D4074E0
MQTPSVSWNLAIDDVDLESLILARNDVHPDGDWWFDPRSGTSLYYGVDDDADLPALVEGVHVLIPGEPQPRSDVDDFFAVAEALGVDDDTIAELYAAYRGKGGLRRFRDRVATSRAAGAWTAFTVERETRRAVAWLRSRGIVDASPPEEHR